ncbi:saccharopine dehydrogenase C-terminal domain-containing protein [Roseburia hominis]
MRMMLVGSGAVGECIVKMLKDRDKACKWFSFCLLCDLDLERAKEVAEHMNDSRFAAAYVNATDKAGMEALIQKYNIDFVMDAASPFCANYIFDAAFACGVDYGNMGTWSVPKKNPAYGLGIENSYDEIMTAYNFDRDEAWRRQGNTALICLGIDPGVVNVFARYLCEYEFDEVTELHVRDGGNLEVDGDEEDIVFGFNVWTVLDEVMNPNVEYDAGRGGFLVEKPFAGQETFCMPEVGDNTFVKVEHEETVTMPRYLSKYGLKKCTFKISLDEKLIQALKVLDHLHLNSLEKVKVGNVEVVPRDVVAACAPAPQNIKEEMHGKMVVGVYAVGKKDGKEKKVMMYQSYSNEEALNRFSMQAVVAQTGFGAALALELYARGIYHIPGVHSLEAFDPRPYLELMEETGFFWHIKEYD